MIVLLDFGTSQHLHRLIHFLVHFSRYHILFLNQSKREKKGFGAGPYISFKFSMSCYVFHKHDLQRELPPPKNILFVEIQKFSLLFKKHKMTAVFDRSERYVLCPDDQTNSIVLWVSFLLYKNVMH